MIALILFNLFAFSVIAQAQNSYGGGTGWEEDPFIISTTDHLDQLAATVNSGGSLGGNGYFRLDADLDYSGKTYTPIGCYAELSPQTGYYGFNGVFDGNGHTITNVTINSNADCVGLFGLLTGTVKNLILGSGSTINGSGIFTGGIVGRMSGLMIEDLGFGIFNCVVSEGVTITGGSYTGGILGHDEGNLYVNGNLCLATVSGSDYVGGIIGYSINDRVVGNYYANPCNVGGIDGNDVAGKAEMAYALTFSAEYPSDFIYPLAVDNAIVHNNKVYAPAETEIPLSKYAYSTLGSVARYAFSGGTSVTLQREVVMTMPASDVTATVTQENVWGVNSRTISTTEGLDLLAYWVLQGNNFINYTFNLNADLDYTGLIFQPIGRTTGEYFRGVFNGNGHTISGVTISVNQTCQGLFGYLSNGGEVKNLRIDNSTINGSYAGGIAGRVNGGTVRNCVVGENVSVSGNNFVGGIVGRVENGTVEDNLFVGSVSGNGASTGSIIGREFVSTVNRNYNIGNCNEGGINGSDVPGSAERAYSFTIQATETASATYQYPTALDNAAVLDGQYYAPYGAEVGLSAFAYVEDGLVARYAATGATIVPQQRGALMTMPTSAATVTVTVTPEDVWNGNREISTVEGLDLFSYKVNKGNKYENLTFNLEADLDYTGLSYEPIGYESSNSFYGVFNGNSHTISGIYINGTISHNRLGVFGYLSGEVNNLKIENSVIQGNNYLGGVAGRSKGTVRNCVVGENVSIISIIDNSRYAGGLVGAVIERGTVKDNLSFASVTGVNYCGSLIGSKTNAAVVSNNYYSGTSTYGGIGNADVSGQAMRGYAIEPSSFVSLGLEGTTGLAYNGMVYAGQGQSVVLAIGLQQEFASLGNSYVASAGTLTQNGDTWTLVMPEPGEDVTIDVDGDIVFILLDNDAGEAYNNANRVIDHTGETHNVMLQDRTFHKDGTWSTLCLPFSLATLVGTPLEGAEIRTVETTSFANGILTINFGEPLDAIEAGYPYFFRWTAGDNITNPVFMNVTLQDGVAPLYYDETDMMFIGFYYSEPIQEGYTLYLGDDQKLHYPFTELTLHSCRAFFTLVGETEMFTDVSRCDMHLGTETIISVFPAIVNAGAWNDDAVWNTSSIPQEGSHVAILADAVIPADFTAHVGDLLVYGGSLTLADGGQLYHNNEGVAATVQKDIEGYVGEKDNYYLIGYPFAANGAVADMTNLLENDYDLYYYDEPTHYWMNQEFAANNFTELEAARGYLYANSADVTLGLKGTLRTATETVNIPLSYTDGIELAGFNLVGNPFAHNVTTFTGSNIADEIYCMNDLRNELTVAYLTDNNPLKPGEGFFVKATGSNATITFNDNGGAKGGSKALEPVERPTIALEISQNGLLIDRLILKTDGAPLEKFTLNENGTKIYAAEGGEEYAVAVVGRDAMHCVSTEPPVHFKAAQNGTYTLTVNVENMDLDYLHLIDNLTGEDVDMLASPTYTFAAKTSDYVSRFRLVFSAAGASAGSASDAPFAYISNGEIVINGEGTLQVIDMLGHVVRAVGLSHRGSRTTTTGMPAGMYVLRLIEGDSVRTQKIVIP